VSPPARTFEHAGLALTVREWAERSGVGVQTIYSRLAAGHSVGAAIGELPLGPMVAPLCCLCGVAPAIAWRGGRCNTCRHVRQHGALVDMHTPYARDAAAQAFVAEHEGGATLELVGLAMGVTRERIRQIEASALARFRRRAHLAGLDADDLVRVLSRCA
jgi:hypothetical protein